MAYQTTNSSLDSAEIQELLAQKNYLQAEALIRHHIKNQPNDAEGHYLLGVMYYFQGKISQTVDSIQKALSLNPHHTDAAVCLSVLLNDLGKYDGAKQVFEQANQSINKTNFTGDPGTDKKFAVKHLELADLYFRYRRYDEAIEEYNKAVHLDPTALEIKIRRAKAYAKKGFLTRSMQELQQLKREHPNFSPARIQLGLLHYSQGNLLDAELEWESVFQLEPKNREAQNYLEMSKKTRGQA
jgi:tetratricopeptide (TPR) repeat protein